MNVTRAIAPYLTCGYIYIYIYIYCLLIGRTLSFAKCHASNIDVTQASYTTSRSNVIDVDYRPLNDVSDGGDVTAEQHHRHVPPPPPPPRGGLYWRQQQQQQNTQHPANDQDRTIVHNPVSSATNHVTEISPSDDRRQIGDNGDVTLRRAAGAVGQRQFDDRVYHITDGHATIRPHLEVIV